MQGMKKLALFLIYVECIVNVISDQEMLIVPSGKSTLWNSTWTDMLKKDLLHSYDKFARPAQHTNTTTVVMDLIFKHVELDDQKSMMMVNAWVSLQWTDEKLKWNVSDYGELTMLHLGDHEIWEPDIVLYNSAAGNNIDHFGNTHVIVNPSGLVLWVPPAQFSVFCNLDFTYWPFDTHMCHLRLGSWTYNGEQVDLVIPKDPPAAAELDTSNWKVISIVRRRSVIYYACCSEPYIDVSFNVTLKRESASFYVTLINPAIVIAFMILSIFWIPPNSGIKFIMSGITALLIGMFLIYFFERLPIMGYNTPLIVLFYSYSLVFVGISFILSVITFNMSTYKHNIPIPHVVGSILNSKFAIALYLPDYKTISDDASEEMSDRGLNEERNEMIINNNNTSKDWILVSIAIDRIAFLLYLIIFLILGVRCLT